ncbi:hypothetical protein BTHA_2651 [Burkholderia thailandensis MSMB59]|nr:hypothetical protein BTHA_2651 [Burkholderia thailandensis MSMB59]
MKAAVPCGFRAAAGFAASRPRALDADGIPPAPSRAGVHRSAKRAARRRAARHPFRPRLRSQLREIRETAARIGNVFAVRLVKPSTANGADPQAAHSCPAARSAHRIPARIPHVQCGIERPVARAAVEIAGGRPLRVFRGSRPQRRRRQGHPARRPPAALLSRCFSGRRPFELGSGRRIVVCAVATSRRDINTRPTPLTRLPRCQHARDVLAGHARDARSCCCAPRKTIIAGSRCHIASADAACARPRRSAASSPRVRPGRTAPRVARHFE